MSDNLLKTVEDVLANRYQRVVLERVVLDSL